MLPINNVMRKSRLKLGVLQHLLQAQDKFEQWHAEKWLSPRRVLQKAGAQMRPVLLPFWLFEAAIKVEYTAQVSKDEGTLTVSSSYDQLTSECSCATG